MLLRVQEDFNRYMYLNLCNVVEHHASVDDAVDELNIDYTIKTNKDEGDH